MFEELSDSDSEEAGRTLNSESSQKETVNMMVVFGLAPKKLCQTLTTVVRGEFAAVVRGEFAV